MIHSEAGLIKTQELAAELERTLAELRHRVQPVSEQKFRLMAEGYVTQIRQLRDEIDEYLGIASFEDPPRRRQDPVHA